MAKSKIFRDPVHGYIAIDEDIVNDFIDTQQFQRLKRIKQTHLDVLFPTANQTRFEHSLGVYFLGKKLFKSIENNCPSKYLDELKSYRSTVELACLLHDIGHAPLSHIGEEFYKRHHEAAIIEKLGKEGIKIDKYPLSHSPHELMSVLIGVTVFGKQLEGRSYDKDLFFRLITGSHLNMEGCDDLTSRPVKKALISILSSSFDVDKMDYIMRDSATAGIPSVELDLDRIINSACLVERPICSTTKDSDKEIIIAFGKSGFSVVTAIVNNRNYMYKWIYGHHKVQYQYYILTQFLKKLCDKSDFSNLFSYEAITGTPVSFDKMKISLTDDHDMWFIFKNANLEGKHFETLRDQLFQRKHYKAIWKTKIEFDQEKIIFGDKLKHILSRLEPPDEFFSRHIKPQVNLGDEDILIFKSNFKIVFPDLSSNMYFWLKDKYTEKIIVKDYGELFGEKAKEDEGKTSRQELEKQMFHIFVKKDKYSPTLHKQLLSILARL